MKIYIYKIIFVGMAELVNALDLGSKIWEFKSLYP